MSNRLANETSPYLRQHADNPVDWYPWGEEAFAKARREEKPVLLSVGYASCHWCHVMAHESFEDPETAAVMNEHFVSVKVDREERPDVDAIYMSAVQAMTGQGGWPMTVAMTADGRPFFGGTYFPPEDRWGRPSFKRVLLGLAQAWNERRDEVLNSAREVGAHLQRMARLEIEGGELDPHVFTEALASFGAIYDPRHGGFGGAPKFPPHTALKYLLARPEEGAQRIAHNTLEKMARGGIFDQLGGGFARYSVDERWLVPHFEKMLYDNAQLLSRYAEAYARRPLALYERVITQTVAWLEREMSAPGGGFYSALDADSEGEEGKYYVWTAAEFDELLGADAELARAYFGVSREGNFEEGANVLTAAAEPEALAERMQLGPAELAARLERARGKLFAARSERVRPGLDDKILTSWNGLAIAGLADAGRALGRPAFAARAARAARFLREEVYQDGRLQHVYGPGGARVPGLLEDYAYLALGLLALYRATFEREWLTWALELADAIREHFVDGEEGGFFTTPDDGERLVVRPKEPFDGATPSGNGAAAELFMHLARLTGDGELERLAVEAIRPYLGGPKREAVGFSSVLIALEWLLAPPRELAVVGPSANGATRRLLRAVQERFLPYAVAAQAEGPEDDLVGRLAFLQGKDQLGGRPTAYVCEGGTCRLPVTTPDELREQLTAELSRR